MKALTIFPVDLARLTVDELAALPIEQQCEVDRHLDEALAWLKAARVKFDVALIHLLLKDSLSISQRDGRTS